MEEGFKTKSEKKKKKKAKKRGADWDFRLREKHQTGTKR